MQINDAHQVAADVFKADLFGNYEANMQARERQREEWKENLKQQMQEQESNISSNDEDIQKYST
jgi:hypothetical protein